MDSLSHMNGHFNYSIATSTIIAISLIVAGHLLMYEGSSPSRVYGSYAFVLGFFLLALAASGSNISGDFSTRTIISLSSVAAIVIGTLLSFYHVHARSVDVPMIDNILIYLGYIGLIYVIGFDSNGVNYVKLGLAIAAIAIICYNKYRLMTAFMNGENLTNKKLLYIFSWVLLILAISYEC